MSAARINDYLLENCNAVWWLLKRCFHCFVSAQLHTIRMSQCNRLKNFFFCCFVPISQEQHSVYILTLEICFADTIFFRSFLLFHLICLLLIAYICLDRLHYSYIIHYFVSLITFFVLIIWYNAMYSNRSK